VSAPLFEKSPAARSKMPSPSSYLPSVPHVTATKIKFPKTQASVFCSPSFPQGEVCHNQVWQARVTAGEQTLNFATGETCSLPRIVTFLERVLTQSTHSEGIPAVDCSSPLPLTSSASANSASARRSPRPIIRGWCVLALLRAAKAQGARQ